VRMLIEALQGHVRHFLSTGTIWVHGYAEVMPTRESASRRPFGQYGINKNEIEKVLMQAVETQDFPATIIHPGHIVGPGWPCLNPQGNFNLKVFQTILDGDELVLPNLGLESVHHVHADDVAQIFQKAIENPHQSIGESFHAVSSGALTLRGYAEAAYRWFGHQPKLRFMPLADLEKQIESEDFQQTVEHVTRSPCMSIEKARTHLNYEPRHTSLQSCRESVEWMIGNGRLKAGINSSKKGS
jgi:nucleoside-diphosphate-sugar epimerase